MRYIIWIVPSLIIVLISSYIYVRIRHFSRTLFATDSLIEGLRQEKLAASKAPRSLHSMEPVYLPMIRRDFPDLHIDELKQKAERVLRSSLQAIASGDATLLTAEASQEIRQRVATEIHALKEQGLIQHYEQIKLHRTVVSDYKKEAGLCRLSFQTALESYAWLEKEGKVLSGERQFRSQLVFVTDYLYVQDLKKAGGQSALGIVCPQCGAPVTNLGRKFCSYCGSGIQEIHLHVWRLADFRLL